MNTFTLDGRAPKAGELFKNEDLANTLEQIGATNCTSFYEGAIAEAIANFSAVSGLLLTKADLARHTGAFVDPVNSTYRGRYRLFELPPNPQGIAAIQQLNILEGFNLSAMGHNTAVGIL
jgi:gamma-glutamyltranspeptidase/glutathione hydrolase